MTAPSWHEPVATARREAERSLSRGLAVRPTLVAFEGDEPTLYVRSRLVWDHFVDRDLVCRELVALPALLGQSRLLVVSPGRLTDPSVDDPVLADALADRAVTVDVAERDDQGGLATSGYVLPYTLGDDGHPTWDAPIHLPDGGPWAATVAQVLMGGCHLDDDGRLGAAGFAYALSRRGMVIAVAPDWRTRYELDRPVNPRLVRTEDRRRAQRYASRRRHPTTAAGGSR